MRFTQHHHYNIICLLSKSIKILTECECVTCIWWGKSQITPWETKLIWRISNLCLANVQQLQRFYISFFVLTKLTEPTIVTVTFEHLRANFRSTSCKVVIIQKCMSNSNTYSETLLRDQLGNDHFLVGPFASCGYLSKETILLGRPVLHYQKAVSLSRFDSIYCRVPARWGLQQTHPGLRAATTHGVRDPLVRSQVD